MSSIVSAIADTSDAVPIEDAPGSPPSPAAVVLPPGTVACEQCSVPVAKARLSEHEQFECPFALFACPFSRDTFGYPHCHIDEYATRADTLAHVTESLPLHVLYLLDTIQTLHNQLRQERQERIKAEQHLSDALAAIQERLDQNGTAIGAHNKQEYSKHKLLRINKTLDGIDSGMKDELIFNGLQVIIQSADDTKSPLLRLVPASSLSVQLNSADAHNLTPRGADAFDVPLKVSVGGWRPISRITRSATSPPQPVTSKSILNPPATRPSASSSATVDPNDLAAVTKQMRSILNKMTATTYDKLSASLLDLLKSIHNELHLSQLTQLIFDKALNDVFYAAMYAKLSHLLCDHLLPNDERKGFKYYLLNQCQVEFEKGANAVAAVASTSTTSTSSTPTSTATDKTDLSSSTTDTDTTEATTEPTDIDMNARLKAKRRMISCIRFIGELYVESLIGENIMTACILHLFHAIDTDTDIDALDEHCEGLSKLFLTIGTKFDNQNNRIRMDGMIKRIETVTNENERLSKCACFLLREVIDRRNHQWKLREATAEQSAQQTVLQSPATENDRSGHSDYRDSSRLSSSHHSHNTNNQHRSSSHNNRPSSRAISSPAPLPPASMPPLFAGMSGLGAGASDFMALAMAQMQLQYSHALAINAAQSTSGNNHRDSHHNDRRSSSYGRR